MLAALELVCGAIAVANASRVVASRVWGCVGGYSNFVFLWVHRAVGCVVGGSFLGRRVSDCIVASRVWGWVLRSLNAASARIDFFCSLSLWLLCYVFSFYFSLSRFISLYLSLSLSLSPLSLLSLSSFYLPFCFLSLSTCPTLFVSLSLSHIRLSLALLFSLSLFFRCV